MKTPPERHTVALAVDNRMVYALLVLVGSLVRTAKSPLHLVIGYFPSQLTKTNHTIIDNFLTWIGVEYEILSLEPHPLFTERRHLTITTFAKFVLADQIPRPHLWLDVDTIVNPGWDDVFASILDASTGVSLVVADMISSKHTRFAGFNAGVLGWTASVRKPWVDALSQLPEKRFSSEQFLFNVLYGDSVRTVGSAYNFLSSWHQDLDPVAPPKILHYSGPIKPWHLARRHAVAWQSINRTWGSWFDAEEALLRDLAGDSLLPVVRKLRHHALFSARLHTGKGAFAGWVMRGLVVLGPLGGPLVSVLTWRARS